MSIFRRRFCGNRQTFSRRRGYQGRHNFGITKLTNVDASRHDNIKEMIGEDAYQEIVTPQELSNAIMEATGYMTVVDKLFWCGDNYRLAMLEYIDEKGRLATRLIEYYSFRRSTAGNILMYAWSHRETPGGIRSYRLDRIVSVLPTMLPYEPRWPVEIITV